VATSQTTGAGLVLTLSHDEVQYALYATEGAQWLGGIVGGIVTAAYGPVAGVTTGAAITGYFTVQKAHIAGSDKGAGIYLTIPWPALVTGNFWLFFIGSVPVIPESGWGQRDDGEIQDDDKDVIRFHIDHGVVGIDSVEFVLATEQDLWRKWLFLVDGLGGSWRLETDMSKRSDVNGLYLYQLPTGKVAFWKAKLLGQMYPKIELPISHLRGGDRVTFTWVQDG